MNPVWYNDFKAINKMSNLGVSKSLGHEERLIVLNERDEAINKITIAYSKIYMNSTANPRLEREKERKVFEKKLKKDLEKHFKNKIKNSLRKVMKRETKEDQKEFRKKVKRELRKSSVQDAIEKLLDDRMLIYNNNIEHIIKRDNNNLYVNRKKAYAEVKELVSSYKGDLIIEIMNVLILKINTLIEKNSDLPNDLSEFIDEINELADLYGVETIKS